MKSVFFSLDRFEDTHKKCFFFQVRTSCLASVDVTLDENRSLIEPKVVIRFTKETLSFLPRHKGVVICRFGVEGGVIRAGAGFTWGMRFLLHFYFCPAINLIVCHFFSNSLTFLYLQQVWCSWLTPDSSRSWTGGGESCLIKVYNLCPS